MAQFALGDIKYTKRAANNTVHREKLHGAIHFGRHKITQRAVNNTVHQAKLTDIGQLTLDHIHAHTHTHLLRNILSNYCCGVHRACTNNPLKSDRKNGMTWRENQCRRILCPCNKQLFHLTKSAVNQIAKTVHWIRTCYSRSSEEGPDAVKSKRNWKQTTCRYLA